MSNSKSSPPILKPYQLPFQKCISLGVYLLKWRRDTQLYEGWQNFAILRGSFPPENNTSINNWYFIGYILQQTQAKDKTEKENLRNKTLPQYSDTPQFPSNTRELSYKMVDLPMMTILKSNTYQLIITYSNIYTYKHKYI